MNPPALTIGIPTYNRREQVLDVVSRAQAAFSADDRRHIELLVIDDDSTDGTYQALLERTGSQWPVVERNEVRAGFCGNFLNLIRRCRTEYLLISTDDDFLNAGEVLQVHDFLSRTNRPPAMVSTVFRNPDGSLYRGRLGVEPIAIHEYRNCCNHLPGVVFNARLAQTVLDRIEPLIRVPDNAYPQAFLSFTLLALGFPCTYLPFEPVVTGYDLPTGIGKYSSVAGRWSQFKMFNDFFIALRGLSGSKAFVAVVDQCLEEHRKSLFRTLGNGVVNEFPEFAPYYLSGAAAFTEAGSKRSPV